MAKSVVVIIFLDSHGYRAALLDDGTHVKFYFKHANWRFLCTKILVLSFAIFRCLFNVSSFDFQYSR